MQVNYFFLIVFQSYSPSFSSFRFFPPLLLVSVTGLSSLLFFASLLRNLSS